MSEKERKKRQAALDRLEIVRECIDARDDLEGDIGSTGYKSQVLWLNRHSINPVVLNWAYKRV